MKIKDETIGGLSAGIVGTVIGYPLDLIKTRMQTSSNIQTNKGIVSQAYHISKTAKILTRIEGIRALYKGMIPPLISLSILNTVTFTLYSSFRKSLNASNGWDIRNGMAGGIIGPCASIISTVEHFVKTQMQLDNISGKRYRNSLDCVQTLLKSHGIRILYTGHVVNTLREFVFLSSYFFIYEGMKESLTTTFFLQHNNDNDNKLMSMISIPLAGGMSGAMSWLISFPLDCIKTGIQKQQVSDDFFLSNKQTKAKDVALQLIRERGFFRGFYTGVSPSIARAFLVSGSRFSAYEFALWLLK